MNCAFCNIKQAILNCKGCKKSFCADDYFAYKERCKKCYQNMIESTKNEDTEKEKFMKSMDRIGVFIPDNFILKNK